MGGAAPASVKSGLGIDLPSKPAANWVDKNYGPLADKNKLILGHGVEKALATKDPNRLDRPVTLGDAEPVYDAMAPELPWYAPKSMAMGKIKPPLGEMSQLPPEEQQAIYAALRQHLKTIEPK